MVEQELDVLDHGLALSRENILTFDGVRVVEVIEDVSHFCVVG